MLKLGICVCKRTIQKYMRHVRLPRSKGQNWKTFLRNHAADIWASDFLQVTDLFFRSLFAFFNTLLRSRKVIHVGVTRTPTDAWAAQQLREATPYGHTPQYLIRDNDSKFGPVSLMWQQPAVSRYLKRLNTICERFLGSVRRECLDHVLILQEKQLQRILHAYVAYFNQARPHQGIQQRMPQSSGSSPATAHEGTKVVAVPILAGLHHDYQKVA